MGVDPSLSETRTVNVTLLDGTPLASYTLPEPYDIVAIVLIAGPRDVKAVGSNDYVRVFDVTTGQQLRELQGRGGDVHVVSPRPICATCWSAATRRR